MRTLTHAEWKAEAVRRFGEDVWAWAFVCPSCGHIATVKDWKDAGASDKEVAFSCVGRHHAADDAKTFGNQGGPCQYAGGGLFRLNPVQVDMGDGSTLSTFEFAPGGDLADSPAASGTSTAP